MAPPLFSPPVFKHGTHSQSCNQTGLHTFTEVLRCGKGRGGGIEEQTSLPVACLSCSAVKARICVCVRKGVHVCVKDLVPGTVCYYAYV